MDEAQFETPEEAIAHDERQQLLFPEPGEDQWNGTLEDAFRAWLTKHGEPDERGPMSWWEAFFQDVYKHLLLPLLKHEEEHRHDDELLPYAARELDDRYEWRGDA